MKWMNSDCLRCRGQIMADTQTCAVHSLIEEIQNGTVMVKPYMGNLRWLEETQAPPGDPLHEVIAEVRQDGRDIAHSHKFDFSSWPHETTALSGVLLETGTDMVNSQVAALPFPSVVFCKRVQMSEVDDPLEELLLLRERRGAGDAVLSFRAYQRLVKRSSWFFCGFTAAFRYSGAGTEYTTEWIADPKGGLDPRYLDEVGADMPQRYADMKTTFFLSALAALSSRGPLIRTQPAPEKLNRQRAKKGKPPIFEYRIVEIPAWAVAKAESQGGTHASPRLHWRRGHERRLGNGRKTFVHAHLVGSADNGFIHKDYASMPPPVGGRVPEFGLPPLGVLGQSEDQRDQAELGASPG